MRLDQFALRRQKRSADGFLRMQPFYRRPVISQLVAQRVLCIGVQRGFEVQHPPGGGCAACCLSVHEPVDAQRPALPGDVDLVGLPVELRGVPGPCAFALQDGLCTLQHRVHLFFCEAVLACQGVPQGLRIQRLAGAVPFQRAVHGFAQCGLQRLRGLNGRLVRRRAWSIQSAR